MEKQGRYRKPRIEFFLANFISGMIAGEVTLSKLFSEYKAFLNQMKKTPSTGYSQVEDELKDLARYGSNYKTLMERSEADPLGTIRPPIECLGRHHCFPACPSFMGAN